MGKLKRKTGRLPFLKGNTASSRVLSRQRVPVLVILLAALLLLGSVLLQRKCSLDGKYDGSSSRSNNGDSGSSSTNSSASIRFLPLRLQEFVRMLSTFRLRPHSSPDISSDATNTTKSGTSMLSRWFYSLAAGVLTLSVAQLPQAGSATLLFASSYGGTVTTLNLTIPAAAAAGNQQAKLEAVASTEDCYPQPSWLTLDHDTSTLYCVGEGLTTRNGSLVSFRTNPDGSLEQLNRVNTISGPVSSVLYGSGGQGLALAHYTGSSMSSFNISDFGRLQAETWDFPVGPNRTRQNAPHPHEAALDPTGSFLLVPDLGSDLVRVFTVGGRGAGLALAEAEPLEAAPGSGPRHVVFLVSEAGKTFMYLLGEISNTVTAYEVSYGGDCEGGEGTLGFKEVLVTDTHGGKEPVPSTATAAEIHLSPDNRFLIVSSRYERAFKIPNFDPANGTAISSDTLINFSVDQATGALTAVQTFPAGGLTPRQFSINRAGDLVAVGLQDDGRVAVIQRDVRTGMLGGFVATAPVEVGVTCVLFDE